MPMTELLVINGTVITQDADRTVLTNDTLRAVNGRGFLRGSLG